MTKYTGIRGGHHHVKKPISAFDEFVQKWYRAGGTDLTSTH